MNKLCIYFIVSNTPPKGIRKLGIYNIGKTSPHQTKNTI
jgi:hypothetical protein